MKLEPASLTPPKGIMKLLNDLGDGENGFGGNPVYTRRWTLEKYLQHCMDNTDPEKIKPPQLVPQTTFWLLDNKKEAVGIFRVRHWLNDDLEIHGGHCGYFIRSDRREQGFGSRGLKMALSELKKMGNDRALITVHPANIPSIRVVESNGGVFQDEVIEPHTSVNVRRFWIELG